MPKRPAAAAKPKAHHQYDYDHFSRLAGPLRNWSWKNNSVHYQRVLRKGRVGKPLLLILLTLGFELTFLIWLFMPSHITLDEVDPWIKIGTIALLAGIAVIESFRLVNIISLCRAVLIARDPIPVRPKPGSRVAFTTAIVPSKEPFEMVRKTLEKMREVRHDGTLDVWLLDEGNDPRIKRACKRMGVKHFSRKGIEKWNTPTGRFKARTKHGNHNAWLDAHGDQYDYVLSVDSDHVPLPSFAERMLGYFRDPDVAFVVGPQVYGNYKENLVTMGAESQSYIFQAAVQRAGNAHNAAMFVGTNHAYRVETWKQIGGFQDSITEDMLTSLMVHSNKNPHTGKYWKSVYTPDVVAVGEGPSSWTDFFSQQLRWARGSNEILLVNFMSLVRRLSFRRRLHYSLMIAYYPSIAINWVLGVLAGMLYLLMGNAGLTLPGDIWLALYVDLMVIQLSLYAWFRKYNVSPHEERGTVGFLGIFLSLGAVPVYVTALTSALLRRSVSFVVTPKGDSASPDRLITFKKHFVWIGLVVGFVLYSAAMGNLHAGAALWCVLTLSVCLAPIVVWLGTIRKDMIKYLKVMFRRPFAARRLKEVGDYTV